MKKYAIYAIVALTVSACGTIYTFEGEKYNSKAEFLAAGQRTTDEAINAIQPLPQPLIQKKLIFASSSLDLVKQNFLQLYRNQQKKDPNYNEVDMVDGLMRNDSNIAAGFGKAIKRRNIYSDVQIMTIESPSSIPEAGPNVDVLYNLSADGKPAQWYFVTQKSGRQVFAYDLAVTGTKERTKSFVEAVQAYALRN